MIVQSPLLVSIKDKYIVAYKHVLHDNSHCLCIVMELLPGGDVQRGRPFTEAEIWKALIHMTRGYYNYDQKIVHRDLKSAKVFLANDGTFKLADLNVSKVAKKGLVQPIQELHIF